MVVVETCRFSRGNATRFFIHGSCNHTDAHWPASLFIPQHDAFLFWALKQDIPYLEMARFIRNIFFVFVWACPAGVANPARLSPPPPTQENICVPVGSKVVRGDAQWGLPAT